MVLRVGEESPSGLSELLARLQANKFRKRILNPGEKRYATTGYSCLNWHYHINSKVTQMCTPHTWINSNLHRCHVTNHCPITYCKQNWPNQVDGKTFTETLMKELNKKRQRINPYLYRKLAQK